jgi:hypothetical protein
MQHSSLAVDPSNKRKRTPAALLKLKFERVRDLADALDLSRFQAYGLTDPRHYPIPPAIFDVRSDLAERVGQLIGLSADDVRKFYDRD